MASREEIFSAVIKLNDHEAISKLQKMETQLAALKKRRDEALQQGRVDVWKAANKEIDKLEVKVKKQNQLIGTMNHTLDSLSTAKQKELEQILRDINRHLNSGAVERNSKEWKELNECLKQTKHELQIIKSESEQQTSAWGKFTGFLNKNWGAITQIFGAITGISATIRSAVNDYASMQEEMADVRKYTGLSAEKIEELNEKFKQMDTRTSREELNQLAGAAGRLGIQSTEQIEQFVKAADMIGVALGDDLGEGAVDKIGKLAMAFGEDERMGLQKAMLSTGSAINELAQNSAANAGYLVEFTARVAGFGKQLGLTQAQIMGFGTVMDENLLKDEMAATAFGNMLTKMQTDTATFAKIAGQSIEDFTKLMREDANAAVLAVAESLKRQDPTNMMKMLDSMGLDGSRAVGVLSTLADKIDDVRRHQQRATEAYAEATSVVGEFNTMNNTVQARMDKCKKKFKEMTIELGEKLLPVVQYTISGAGLLAKVLSVLVSWFDKYKIAIITTTATIAALVAWKQKDVIVTKLMTLANEKLWKSLAKLGKFLKTNWMGATITAVVALTTALWEMKRRSDGLTESERNLQKIREQAKKNIVEEEQKIRLLIAAAEDEKLSMDERKKAVEKLNRIIPDYNAQLDETTGKYKANKEALDDYLSSLMRKYEIEGAKESLKELGKELAEAEIALKKAKDSAESVRHTGPASGSQADVFFSIGQKVGANQRVSDAEKAKEKVKEQIEAIKAAYGEELEKEAVQEEVEVKIDPEVTVTDPGSGSGSDDPLKKLEKNLKDALQRQQIEALLSYRQGEISYQQYLDRLDELQKQSFAERRKVYEDAHATERQEYWQLLKEQSDYLDRQAEEGRKKRDSELQRDKVLREVHIRQQYNDIASDIYQDEEAMNEALFRNEREFLQKRIENARQGTQERMQLEQQLADLEERHRLELAENYEKKLKQMRNSYSRLSAQEQMEAELAGLKLLYESKMNQGRISEEQYQQMIQQIREKYAKNIKDEQDERIHKGDKQQSKGTSIADGVFNVLTIADNYKSEMEAIDQMLADHTITEQEAADKRRQIWAESMEGIAAAASVAFQGINQMMSAASSYAQACSDVEVARITANYDRQIEAAGKNSKKRERLEKQKDEAIAKAKTKANKKAMAMEYAQAVASIALGAINAYASAAKLPPPKGQILPPIMAGIALAAGAVQLATIKKQHEAEAAGYYEGGFTGGHRYRREAGVVHEGEFVANHQAVNNRQLMPVFSLLDQAQRNNRVASLRAEDVTNVMGGPASQAIVPIVNVMAPDNSELSNTLEMVRETQDRLATQLEQGIGVDIPIDGENGVYRKIKRYENLLKNK